MAVDIGAIQGLIELKDDFTSQIGLAKAALSNFSAENQESLKAVAGAAGLVAAAITAVTATVVALGVRGSDINDVRNALKQFAGSAEEANAIISALGVGVKGTVNDFDLASQAAHLLSAGVKLTAEQFGMLGSAAAVLADRGLGSSKEMLDLVSDAMVTGRTKALSLKLGVIDAGDAEENYAKTLGTTAANLSETGKAEAHRIEILAMLDKAVKGAGASERDFGEQLKAARVAVQNWVDGLASAIAASPVFEAGMKAIQTAVVDAFGAGGQDAIKTTVDLIEEAAIMAVNFGLGAIEVARVVNVAWSAIKTVILGVETVLMGIAEAVAGVSAMVLTAVASLPGATAGMKETARSARETAESMTAMTNSLMKETAEAAKGVIGQSAFDKTLDKLGGTLYQVKDAMEAANKESEKGNAAVDIAAKNAATMARLHAEIATNALDRSKIEADLWKIEKKSLEETEILWNQYFSIRTKGSRTTLDSQKADIEQWFNDEVAKLDDSDRNWQNHYDALAAIAAEKLTAVMVDWDSVKDKSQEALDQMREKAIATYNAMVGGSLHFSREALAEQLQKVHESTDAARGMGAEFVAAHNAAVSAAQKQVDALEKIKAAAQAAALANRALGGSRTYDMSTEEGRAEFFKMNPMAALTTQFDVKKYFATHTIEDAIKAGLLNMYANWNHAQNPAMHAAEGGVVTVGENGPEMVRLPIGSQVYPTGSGPGGGNNITLHFNVNGNAVESARQIKAILMRELKQVRQFGSA